MVAALGGAEAPRAAGFAACGGASAATAAIGAVKGRLGKASGCRARRRRNGVGRTARAHPRSGSTDRPDGHAPPDEDRTAVVVQTIHSGSMRFRSTRLPFCFAG